MGGRFYFGFSVLQGDELGRATGVGAAARCLTGGELKGFQSEGSLEH